MVTVDVIKHESVTNETGYLHTVITESDSSQMNTLKRK